LIRSNNDSALSLKRDLEICKNKLFILSLFRLEYFRDKDTTLKYLYSIKVPNLLESSQPKTSLSKVFVRERNQRKQNNLDLQSEETAIFSMNFKTLKLKFLNDI